MSVIIKHVKMAFKDPITSEYTSIDAIADRTTDQLVGQIQSEGAAQVSAIETKGQQTRDSIPSDYTELSDDVNVLKSAIKRTDDIVEEVLGVPIPDIKNTAIYLSTGSDFPSSAPQSNRVSTEPIYVPDGKKYTIKASGFEKYAYTLSTNGITVGEGHNFTDATSIEKVISGPRYFRFSFGKTDNSNINVDDIIIKIESSESLPSRIMNVENNVEKNTEDIDNLGNIIGVFDPGKKNVAINLSYGASIDTEVQNANRISTGVIYIPAGAKCEIVASGFERIGIAESSNGSTITKSESLHQATSYTKAFNGERWIRLTFAHVTDIPISVDDVQIHIQLSGTIIEQLDSIKKELDGVVTSCNNYQIRLQDNIGDNIVATYGKSYVRNNNGTLQLSTDSGKTWNTGFDVSSVGLINNYHLYANGCIAFFTHQKAYYSENWESFSEAVVYEQDGVTPYVPSEKNNFFVSRSNKERKFIGNQDIYVFGNYVMTDEENTRKCLYCSTDNGHTYKVIYEFNKEGSYYIRHVHNVIYDPNNDHFLCCTGDSGSQSMIIQMDYSNGTWTFNRLANGIEFKWAGVQFYGEYIYYCFDVTPGKVMRCKYKDIADFSKHEVVLDNLPNDSIGLFIGERGDMAVTLSNGRSENRGNSPFSESVDTRRIFYSKDRQHFTNFIGYNPGGYGLSLYYGFMSPNDDGRVLTGFKSYTVGMENWNRLPSMDIAEMVRKNGYPDAFKPYDRAWEIVPVVDIECNDVTIAEDATFELSPKLYPWNASSLNFEIVDYDSEIIHVDGATITGWNKGSTTAKVRSCTNYDVFKTINITVT